MNLQGKTALITGAQRGIGRAIAERLAAAGAAVFLNYLDDRAGAEALAERIRREGGSAWPVQADVSGGRQVDAMFGYVADTAGKLDILVNNAGVVSYVDFLDLTEAEWDRVIGVNLKGYFLCGQRAARMMRAQGGGGRIVHVSSISQERPAARRTHYCVSKGGIGMLTRGMALELAPFGIRVNAIAPGPTETDLNRSVLSDPEYYETTRRKVPLGRLGQPDDMTEAVLFLVSDRSSWVTGQTIYIDSWFLLI